MGFQQVGTFRGAMGSVTRDRFFRKPVVFYDKVTFEWATNRIVIEDGTIKGFSSIQGSDILSTTWDGTIPLDLNSRDAGATTGYGLDDSAGSIQAFLIFAGLVDAESVRTEKIRLIDLGPVTNPPIALGTDLDSGIFVPNTDQLGFIIDDLEIVTLTATTWEPQLDSNVDLGTSSLQFKDAHIDTVLADHVLTSAGTELLPSHSFESDPNTGMAAIDADTLSLIAGASIGIDIDSAGRVGTHGSATGVRIYSRDNDDQQAEWYNAQGFQMICFVGSEAWRTDATNIRWANHVIVTASNTFDMGTSSVYIDDINADNFFNRSDERIKTDIRATELGSEFIYGLKPRSFEKIKDGQWYEDHTYDGQTHTGFIAQEVRQVLEDQGHDVLAMGVYRDPWVAVENEQDIDFEAMPEQFVPPLHALSYEQFIGPMVQTIQELNQRVIKLENSLTNCPNCARLDPPTTHGDSHAPIAD